jgi:hypothetical protein
MLKKLKNISVMFFTTGMLMMPALVPATVHAVDNISGGLSCGAELDASQVSADSSSCVSEAGDAGERVNGILHLVINIFSLVVGVVAVIMIIVGGFKYITSGGDSGNVTSAKNTILFAVVGLVVVALAQFIVRFVLEKVGAAGAA